MNFADVISNLDIIEIITQLFNGLKNTFLIFIVTLIGSIPLGVLIAIGRLSKIRIVNTILKAYIYIIRGTPLLLQILFIFFVLPEIGIRFDRLPSVYIAFIINYSAYFGEIFRGGIQSIDKGQYEAATVLGINRVKTFMVIILPQVMKRTITSVSNEVITLVKDTALVQIVAIDDILRKAQGLANREASLIPYLIAAFIYLLITAILTKILEQVEKHYAYYE